MTNQDFIGKGWSFPPQFSTSVPGVEMSTGEEEISRSLQILLTTRPGERIMQPKYGCHMEELLFENLDTTTKTIIRDRIETAILYFESRIEVLKIELDDTDQNAGVILIRIEYRINATNSRFNFVFPFYRAEATEMNLLTTNHPLAG